MDDFLQVFPSIAEEGLQSYTENLTRRYELQDRILQSIREGNEYQAVSMVRERNQIKLPGRLRDELTEWKYDLIQMKALIIQMVREKGISDLMLDSIHTELTQRIDRAVSVEECHRVAEEMVRKFCSMNQLQEVSSYPVLVQKVLLAVDMDLSQHLTLQYFADSLNVNDSYLSNLFRKEVGVTLTDYVTDRRVRRAADLLLTTQHPIKTVAKQVGIADVHYFSRIFKKRMGKPPTQYRSDHG